MMTSKMAEKLAGEEQLEQAVDLAKTTIAAKIKELQEECIEIRKNTSGNYKCHDLSAIFVTAYFKILPFPSKPRAYQRIFQTSALLLLKKKYSYITCVASALVRLLTAFI